MMSGIATRTIAGTVLALALPGCVVIPISPLGDPVVAPAQVVAPPVLPVAAVTPVAAPRPAPPPNYNDGNRPPDDDDDNPWN